jgi:hypothetical protein
LYSLAGFFDTAVCAYHLSNLPFQAEGLDSFWAIGWSQYSLSFFPYLIQREFGVSCLRGMFSSESTGPMPQDHSAEGRVASCAKHGRVIARGIQAFYGRLALVINDYAALMNRDALLIEMVYLNPILCQIDTFFLQVFQDDRPLVQGRLCELGSRFFADGGEIPEQRSPACFGFPQKDLG